MCVCVCAYVCICIVNDCLYILVDLQYIYLVSIECKCISLVLVAQVLGQESSVCHRPCAILFVLLLFWVVIDWRVRIGDCGNIMQATSTTDTFQEQDINYDVERLRKWLVNEKCCNDILPYQEELVSGFADLCEFQQSLVETRAEKDELAIVRNLKEMELERIRYLLKEYLRTRLRKIENSLFYLWRDKERWSWLSAAEAEYAKQ